MAIYFGNLDKELAERQNVIKEDAARQYHGSREVMKAFSDLGTQFADNIEKLGVPEWLQGDPTYDDKGKMVRGGWGGAGTQDLEVAKIDYNLHRQTESDRLRDESHKDLRLQRRLTNIEGYNKVRSQQHSAMQWNNFNPQAVQKKYDNRMKVLDKDLTNVAAVERIMAYPQLFGKDAVAQVNTLRKLERAGDEKGAKNIRDSLPLAPLPYMDWAIEQKYFNDKITGNPLAVGNRMYTSALREAGYNVPDPNELNKQFSKDYTGFDSDGNNEIEGETVEDLGNVNEQLDLLLNGRIKHKKGGHGSLKPKVVTDPNVIPDTIEALTDVVLGTQTTRHPHGGLKTISKKDLDYLKFTHGASEWMDKLDASKLPTGSEGYPIPPDEEGEVAAEGETRYDKDGNLISVSTGDAEYLNFVEGVQGNYSGLSANQSDFSTMANAADNGNQFTIDLGSVGGNTGEVIKKINKENTPGKSLSDSVYNLEGPEVGRDPAFFPFTEGYKGGALGSEYSRLPNYSTWENVSDKEKEVILTHPETEFGASPKSVAALIKVEDELQEVNDEIYYLQGEVSKRNTPLDTYGDYTKSIESIPWFNTGKTKKYGGMLDEHPEKRIAKENLARKLPLLEEQKNKLMNRVDTAQATVDGSKPKNSKVAYSGSNSSDYGISNAPGPATIRPKPRVDTTPGMALAPGSTATEPLYVAPDSQVIPEQSGDIEGEIIEGIIDREGWGPANAGYSYFDGGDPDERGYYKEGGGETLTLAGGNNIWGTINSMPVKERKGEIEEVATAMFGDRGVRRKEFIKFMNMPKEDHKKEYDSIVKRGRLRLTKGQRDYLTGYSYRNHLDRLVKNNPYLSDIAQYPKEMQVFLMDNAFNMGPKWLSKFKKTEVHLKNWVTKGRKSSDLKKMKAEYKKSDHYRNTTRAKDLVAMLTTG